MPRFWNGAAYAPAVARRAETIIFMVLIPGITVYLTVSFSFPFLVMNEGIVASVGSYSTSVVGRVSRTSRSLQEGWEPNEETGEASNLFIRDGRYHRTVSMCHPLHDNPESWNIPPASRV